MNRQKGKGYVLILFSAVLWGLLPVFTRKLYANNYSPIIVSSMRAYIGAIGACILMIIMGDYKKFQKKDISFYLLYGLFSISGSFLLYASSMKLNSTAVAAMLLYTGPTFVNIFDRIFYQKKLTWIKIVSLIITFVGCALVVQMYELNTFSENIVGIFIGLLSGICYSLTTVLGETGKKRYPGRTNGWLILMFGSCIFLLIQPPWKMPVYSIGDWGLFVGLAFFCSILPYTFYLSGLATGIDGGIASIVATVEPVMAIVFGVIFFADSLQVLQIFGIIIVLLGVILPIIFEKKMNS
jgi:hypothetical protein